VKLNALRAEQLHLGELPAKAAVNWTDEQAAESKAVLDADDRLHSQNYPAEKAAMAIRSRLLTTKKTTRRAATLQLGSWLAAAVLIVGVGVSPVLDNVSSERTKGTSAQIAVYRQSGTGVARLADGAKAKAGDRLQVEFSAPSQSWVLVFSVDGGGVLTSHYPEQGIAASQLTGNTTLVPQSYVLDAAPLFERFYLVVGDHPFTREEVWRTLRDRPMEARLPSGLTAYPLTLIKDSK